MINTNDDYNDYDELSDDDIIGQFETILSEVNSNCSDLQKITENSIFREDDPDSVEEIDFSDQ